MLILRIVAKVLTVASIAPVLGCVGSPKQEAIGQYTEDAVISTKVKAAIFNEPTLKSMEINVETFKGRVQLSGFVRTQANASTAIEAARGVTGVLDVKDDMRLK